MPIKVLLINFPLEEITSKPSNIEIESCVIGKEPTVHDYHVIIIDTEEFVKRLPSQVKNASEYRKLQSSVEGLKDKIEEQLKTGGITFCFSGPSIGAIKIIDIAGPHPETKAYGIYPYLWQPISFTVVNESGDTFYPKMEELKQYAPLVRGLPEKEISWSCYFTSLPPESRILATNRAGYTIFTEIPVGQGKLVMLPKFKNRARAVTTIVNQIIPQMIHEEEPTYLPEWLPEVMPPIEREARNLLKEIEIGKRLISTKDKPLKKAVATALEKIGFKVTPLPDGTLPDLDVEMNGSRGKVEVKGHDNRQTKRGEVLQLLGYLDETKEIAKGIFVSNHELQKHPEKRSHKAYTEEAIKLAEKTELCLISTIDLWKLLLSIIEGKISAKQLGEIRTKIMTSSGIVHLP